MLVFPELSLTGYELDLVTGLAFTESDPRLAPLLAAASSCSMTLVVGAPVDVGSRLHLGAFILSPGGGIEIYTSSGGGPQVKGRQGLREEDPKLYELVTQVIPISRMPGNVFTGRKK